eukprot:scaffold7262_cov538-Prasinococcus_capsulatus_cf.AAC.2
MAKNTLDMTGQDRTGHDGKFTYIAPAASGGGMRERSCTVSRRTGSAGRGGCDRKTGRGDVSDTARLLLVMALHVPRMTGCCGACRGGVRWHARPEEPREAKLSLAGAATDCLTYPQLRARGTACPNPRRPNCRQTPAFSTQLGPEDAGFARCCA